MSKILFVDDEGFFAKRYIEALNEQFDVTFIAGAEAALSYLRGNHGDDALVLDIMLPVPQGDPPAAAGGLNTGIWLLQEFKKFHDPWTLPVLILTNRNSVLVKSAVDQLGIPRWLIDIRSKIETPAFYLPGAVHTLIAMARGRH